MNLAAKDYLRHNDRAQSDENMERRIRHPENSQQPYMLAHPAPTQFDESQHRFSTAPTLSHSRLQLPTALIAEHWFSS
jgi:hypothetical protein